MALASAANPRPHCQRSLILRYKTKTDLVSKSAKIGSTLSLEEHQSCIRLVCLSQDGQNNSLRVLVNKIPKFLSVLGSTGRQPVISAGRRERIFVARSSLPLLEYVLQVRGRRMVSIRSSRSSDSDRANFFHGFLGANIVFADEEHNVFNKPECVIQQ